MREWRSPRGRGRPRAPALGLRWIVLGCVLALWPRPAQAQCDGGACVDVAVPDAGLRPDTGVTPRCGDGLCNGAETCGTCSVDCGVCPVPDAGTGPRCGDGLCNGAETCGTCSIDCGVCPIPDAGTGPRCGDGLCNGAESCGTCASDCGACRVCGDGMCTGGETCGTCALDCGGCVSDAGADVPLTDAASVDVPRPVDVSRVDVAADAPPPVDAGVPRDVVTPIDGTPPRDVGTAPDVLTASDVVTVMDVVTPMDTAVSTDVLNPRDVPGSTDVGGADVADAGCTMPPVLTSTPPPLEVTYSWDSPGFFGMGVSYSFGVSFSAMSSAGMGMCTDSLSAGGSAEICGKCFGQIACVAASVSGSGECTMPQVCRTAPNFECDRTRACCSANASITATVSRGFVGEKDFGPFTCGYDVRGSVGGSIAPGLQQGPGCMCQPRRLTLDGRVILGASGGGNCTVQLFGSTWGVGVSMSACANGGVRGAIGCGASLAPIGGASFQISFPRIRIGWIEIAPSIFRRETGSGC